MHCQRAFPVETAAVGTDVGLLFSLVRALLGLLFSLLHALVPHQVKKGISRSSRMFCKRAALHTGLFCVLAGVVSACSISCRRHTGRVFSSADVEPIHTASQRFYHTMNKGTSL